MSLSARSTTGGLLLACALLPVRAIADPVQITSGFLTSSGAFGSAEFELAGEGFDVAGTAEPGVVFPALTCRPCTIGEPIDLRSQFLGTIGAASGTVDGTTYTSFTVADSMVFNAPTINAPTTGGAFTVTQPFTFSSTFVGVLNINTPDEENAFTKILMGQGTVTASFASVPIPEGSPLFDFQSVRYDFMQATPGPDPIPEPMTLLLVGSGLAAALRYRRAR